MIGCCYHSRPAVAVIVLGVDCEGGAAAAAVRDAASKLLAGTANVRRNVMSMNTVVLQEAKRNKRFQFFNEERQVGYVHYSDGALHAYAMIPH